jgi:hypothetical protein
MVLGDQSAIMLSFGQIVNQIKHGEIMLGNDYVDYTPVK